MGDFNGDGFPDVAVIGWQSWFIEVLLWNRDGTLGPAVSYAVPNTSFTPAMAVGDANGDHKQDIYLYNGDEIAVLLGQ